MSWEAQTLLALGFMCLFAIGAMIQTVRVYLWKSKYIELVKALKLGEDDGKTEESNS
jgi:hypothetical protein